MAEHQRMEQVLLVNERKMLKPRRRDAVTKSKSFGSTCHLPTFIAHRRKLCGEANWKRRCRKTESTLSAWTDRHLVQFAVIRLNLHCHRRVYSYKDNFQMVCLFIPKHVPSFMVTRVCLMAEATYHQSSRQVCLLAINFSLVCLLSKLCTFNPL